MKTTTSEPAAPNAEATPLLPMYRPIRNLPIVNSSDVTSAPIQTSCHSHLHARHHLVDHREHRRRQAEADDAG
jgi:hypothetical protein